MYHRATENNQNNIYARNHDVGWNKNSNKFNTRDTGHKRCCIYRIYKGVANVWSIHKQTHQNNRTIEKKDTDKKTGIVMFEEGGNHANKEG